MRSASLISLSHRLPRPIRAAKRVLQDGRRALNSIMPVKAKDQWARVLDGSNLIFGSHVCDVVHCEALFSSKATR